MFDRSYETSEEDDIVYERKFKETLNEDDTYEVFDREEIHLRTKFIDPNVDVENYLLELNIIEKEHPFFDKIVRLITFLLRKRKQALSDNVVRFLIRNLKESNDILSTIKKLYN
jgi:hypothetical protein